MRHYSEQRSHEVERAKDAAVEAYPATRIADHLVHVYEQGGEWHVWLNTEDLEFTGLCIGLGPTRDAAVVQAVAALESVVEFL